MGVVVMGPVGGGLLAAPSETLRKLIPGGSSTTAAAALTFVLANPDEGRRANDECWFLALRRKKPYMNSGDHGYAQAN